MIVEKCKIAPAKDRQGAQVFTGPVPRLVGVRREMKARYI